MNILNVSYPYNIHLFNKDQLNEYYADLNRFALELTQIDIVKLSYKNNISYNIIKDLIDELSYRDNKLPLGDIFINKSYFSLHSSIESQELKMNDKLELIFKSIKDIKINIELMYKLKNISIYNKSKFDEKFITLLNYINNIPIRVNAEPKILDNLDDEIKILKDDLIYFKKVKIDENYKLLKLDNEKYNHINNNIKSSINLNKYYKEIQNKLFLESYPIYIKENDEPIWVDERDTLDVINWVVDNKLKNNNKKNSKIIQDYYRELYKINQFLNVNNIKIFIDNEIPSITKINKDLHLFEDFYYSNNIFFINDNLIFPNNEYSISNSIINNLYKEYFTNVTNNKSNNLYTLNYDKSYQTALSLLIQNILLDLNYYNNDSFYRINMYLDIIQIITCAVNQQNLFESNMSKKEIINNLKNYGFFNNNKAEVVFDNIYYLKEPFLKTVLYTKNILNKYIESNHMLYNKLQFELSKPYYLIQ